MFQSWNFLYGRIWNLKGWHTLFELSLSLLFCLKTLSMALTSLLKYNIRSKCLFLGALSSYSDYSCFRSEIGGIHTVCAKSGTYTVYARTGIHTVYARKGIRTACARTGIPRVCARTGIRTACARTGQESTQGVQGEETYLNDIPALIVNGIQINGKKNVFNEIYLPMA